MTGILLTVNDALYKLSEIQDSYTPGWCSLVKYLTERQLQFNVESVKRYIEQYLEEKYRKVQSYNFHLMAVKNRIRFLFENSNLSDVTLLSLFNFERYMKSLKKKKVNSFNVPEEKILSQDEIKKLIENTPKNPSLIIDFLYHTGCRISETISIELEDCKVSGDHYRIRLYGKGRKERFVDISQDLYHRIRGEYRSEKYLFDDRLSRVAVTNQISRYAKKILNKDYVRAHTFRHSFSTHWAKKFPDRVKALSKYLGHSTSAITMDMYISDTLKFDDLQELFT